MPVLNLLAFLPAAHAAGTPSLLDPASLLAGLGPAALGVIALMVFIESGVLFPFLPGDSLLFTAGLLHLKTAHLSATEDFFRRHGGAAVVLARFVPMVRTFAPLTAGIARYEYKYFALWNITGAAAWAVSVTMLGTWLGHFDIVAKNIDVIAVAMSA